VTQATATAATERPASAERGASRWAALAVRAAGTWTLAGGVAKAFLGTPRDLPALVQRVPLPIAFVFAAVLAVEGFVGTAALLRPARAWPLAAVLLLGFAVVLGEQLASGAASCGCFGGTIEVPPAAGLALDLALAAALLWTRPWRLAQGTRRGDALALLAALLVAAALPLVARRGDDPRVAWVGTRDVAQWKGRRLLETPLATWLDLGEGHDGVWLFYKDSCELCGSCIESMERAERGDRQVTLLRIPEEKPSRAHPVPVAPWFRALSLPESAPFTATPPVRLVVTDGVITEVTSIERPDQCP
jgi:hypothetical protein